MNKIGDFMSVQSLLTMSQAGTINKTENSKNFIKVMHDVNKEEIINEFTERYSNISNVTFTIEPEIFAKMSQNDGYKTRVLHQMDSLLKSSFALEHSNLAYEIKIGADGKMAFYIEVPEREENSIDKELKSVLNNVQEKSGASGEVNYFSDLNAYGIIGAMQRKNRFSNLK